MTRVRAAWFAWPAGVALLGATIWSFRAQPVPVETATVVRGAMTVTIDEEGQTRVRDRYTVSAPVAGSLGRVVLKPGAAVAAGQVVARIAPAVPTPLDARSRAQLQARVAAADAALDQARARAASGAAALDRAERELARLHQLARDRLTSTDEIEAADARRAVAAAELAAARSGVDVAEHDVEAARAALLASSSSRAPARPVDVRAPYDGVILRVFEESERVVPAGTPLVEIGSPAALEIVADLLSTDAVRVAPGAPVLIERWGGPTPLHGRVRLVEPSSFTKVSALGVEEQRVNVIIDFTDAPGAWRGVGDRFALDVRIVVWQRPDALKVPTGALFRAGDRWAVFTVAGGRASLRTISVGARNSLEAEVLDGLAEGETVVVHPSERVSDGGKVVVR